MNFNSKKFESKLPAFFTEILKELLEQGFTVTLVGGVVRDYFLQDVVGKDWDIELTHNTIAFNKDQWKNLGRSFSRYGRTSYLSYDVIRLETKDYQFEFSPPRLEKFEQHLAGEGHKNFSVVFDFKMPFTQAVMRRDFTINCMGIRFESLKQIEFLDPLDGLRHLREGVLHHAGGEFAKDPVRFLRAHRFAQKFNMVFSPELRAILNSMEVSQFSHTYFWTEMQKSQNPLSYLKKLIEEKSLHPELKLPLNSLEGKEEDLRKVLKNPLHHETWIIALEWVGISCTPWQEYFSQSSETCRRLGRWARESRSFQRIFPEIFHGDFEKVRELPEFLLLFDWYFTTKQLLQKNSTLPLLKMIEEFLPEWIHLYRFEVVKDVKHIDPPLRAKYQVWNICQRL